MRQITFQIQRFDGQKHYNQEYSFLYEASKTILWGLTHIKENIDATLTFVAACRVGDCGACAVRVNGQTVLACKTSLDEMLERFGDTLIIGPINNFKVIRDLVVDWEKKVERLKSVQPWLIPQDNFTPDTGCRQTPAEAKEITLQARCILCGACASECNKLSVDDSDFYEPFIYTKAYKFIADSRDKDELAHLKPSLDYGLWRCVRCQECTTNCPKNIQPAQDIAKMRHISIQAGMTDNPGARHALAFCTDLADTGRLNEVKLAMRTEGVIKSISRFPFALRLMRKGKLNPLHSPQPVKDINQIQTIIKAAKETDKQ